MKKRIIALFLLVISCFALLTACGETPAEPETTPEPTQGETEPEASYGPILTEILNTGVIHCGLWADSPTFSFTRMVDGKEVQAGFEYQLILGVAEEIGKQFGIDVTVETYSTDFNGMMAALEADKIMFVPELSPTDERKETWLFTDVYHKSNEAYVALKSNADNPLFTGTLKGVTVAGSLGGIDVDMTRHVYPDAEVIELDGGNAVLEVLSGKADLACMNAVNASMYCVANPDLCVIESLTWEPTDDWDKGCGFCMKYGNEDFAAICNEYFKKVKGDGTFDRWIEEAAQQLSDDVLESFKVEG